MSEPTLPDILLVEDDELDVELFYRKLHKAGLANNVHVANNGLKALQMLEGNREPQPAQHCVLLVDINMPLLDGIEMLRQVRNSETWSELPAFMLTTSEHEPDLEDAHELGIEGYLLKDQLEDALQGRVSSLREHLNATA